MDSTQRKYSTAAWSLLDALSGLRKSVQEELDFLRSISAGSFSQRLEDAMLEIDFITSEISDYLNRLSDMEEGDMEDEYQSLSNRLGGLESLVERLLGR